MSSSVFVGTSEVKARQMTAKCSLVDLSMRARAFLPGAVRKSDESSDLTGSSLVLTFSSLTRVVFSIVIRLTLVFS